MDRRHRGKCSVKIFTFFQSQFLRLIWTFQAVMFLTNPAQWVTYVVIPGSPCTTNVSLSRTGSKPCKLTHLIFLCLTEKKQQVVWQDVMCIHRIQLSYRGAKCLSRACFLYLHCCRRSNTNNVTRLALKITVSVRHGGTDSSAQQTKLKTANHKNAFWEHFPEWRMPSTSIIYGFLSHFPSSLLLNQLQQVNCVTLFSTFVLQIGFLIW